MEWEPIYRIQFKDSRNTEWKIEIESSLEIVIDPSISINVIAATQPLVFEYNNNDDDVFNPIKSSRANIRFISDTNFAYSHLYSTEDLQYRVNVYDSSSLYWRGFIIPNEYIEDYKSAPIVINVKAQCGLESLQNMLYEQDGVQYESQILFNILNKIDVSEFIEFVNVYEASMNSGINDSPMDQVIIDTDVFENMYCDEVLTHVLSKYNACITQCKLPDVNESKFIIYRPVDLIDSSIYGRHFTSPSTKSTINLNPTQYINRTDYTSGLIQDGGVLMVQSPAKKVTINQDYGNKESWLDDWEFNQYIPDSSENSWVEGSTPSMFHIGDYIFGEKSGVILKNDVYNPNYIFFQDIDFSPIAPIASTTDYFVLEFEYGFYNTTSSQVDSIIWTILITQGDYTLCHAVDDNDETTAIWLNPADNPISIIENAPVGWDGWKTFRRQFTGLKTNETIQVKLANSTYSSGVYYAIKNIKFYCTSVKVVEKQATRKFLQRIRFTKIYPGQYKIDLRSKHYNIISEEELDNVVEKQYIKENNINGIEKEKNIILGDVVDSSIDNVLGQFSGALGTLVTSNLSEVAAAFDTNYSVDYSTGGVTVTHSSNKIIFTGTEAGVDFTGSTTITNVVGDLDGSVAYTQASSAGTKQVSIVYIKGGTYGAIDITAGGVTRRCNWNTDRTTTMTAFAALQTNIDAYAAVGIDLGYENPNGTDGGIKFTAQTAGTAYAFTVSVSLFNGNMTWSSYIYINAVDAASRIDTITLTGSSGKASILCDGLTRDVSVEEYYKYTSKWNRRDVSENIPLLQVIGNEIAEQYSRPKQLIQMPIKYSLSTDSSLCIIGNFQDKLNINTNQFPVDKITEWTATNCTIEYLNNYMRYTTTDVDSYIYKSCQLEGASNKIITIKYKVKLGSITSGQIFYSTSSHGRSASYFKSIVLNDDSEWHVMYIDMSDLSFGGNDWINNIITGIWFDLTDQDPVTIYLAYIGFNRKFVFNRGNYDVKLGRWDADLCEII